MMYTHVSKCKNDKIKGEKKRKMLVKGHNASVAREE
jgi:hypothetical protein